MPTKVCTVCGEEKPLSSFHKGEGKLGKRSYCSDCSTIKLRGWRKRNPERARQISRNHYHSEKGVDTYYKRTYGITKKEYDSLCEAQNGRCAICNKISNQKLAVDHDHKTKEVRGLLCVCCNAMLGSSKDSIEILTSAISYLRRLKCRH